MERIGEKGQHYNVPHLGRSALEKMAQHRVPCLVVQQVEILDSLGVNTGYQLQMSVYRP